MAGISLKITDVPLLGAGAGGGPVDPYPYNNPEAADIIAGMDVRPDDTRIGLIDDTVGALKTAGTWGKMDVLYVMAAHDAQAARVNWKTPGTFDLTPVNNPTFTVDGGYSGTSAGFLRTGFNPRIDGVQMSSVVSHFAVGVPALAGTGTDPIVGSFSNLLTEPILGVIDDDSASPRVVNEALHNDEWDANKWGTAGDAVTGYRCFVRTGIGNGAEIYYLDGVSRGGPSSQGAPANNGLDINEIVLLASPTQTSPASSSLTIDCFHLGDDLTATEVLDTYNALEGYKDAVYPFNNPEAALVVQGMTVEPDDTRKALIDDFVGTMIGDGVWAKIDILFVIAAHDEQAGRVNWKNPGTHDATVTNTPTFVADSHLVCNTNNHWESDFTPSVDGVQFTTTDFHVGAKLTSVPGAGVDDWVVFGSTSAGAPSHHFMVNASGDVFSNINTTGALSFWTTAGDAAVGYSILTGNGSAASAMRLWVEGSDRGAPNTAGGTIDTISTRQVRFGTVAGFGGTADVDMQIMHMGARLNTTEMGQLDAAFDTYIAGL